jgi:hypothetical protein
VGAVRIAEDGVRVAPRLSITHQLDEIPQILFDLGDGWAFTYSEEIRGTAWFIGVSAAACISTSARGVAIDLLNV